MDVKSWTIKKAEHKEVRLLNCDVGEDSWESLGHQRDQRNQSQKKPILNIHWKDWCWSWNSNTWPPDAKNWLIRKNPDAGKDWKQKEKATRGLDGWMAWPTQRAWVWASSRSWWGTGKPGVLQSMELQRVKQDWETELNWERDDQRYKMRWTWQQK